VQPKPLRSRPGPRPLPPTDLETAHTKMVTALANLRPHRIFYDADRFDVMSRAKHLQAVLAAVSTYAKAVVTDTAYEINVNLFDETGFLDDAAAEVVGAMMNAQDRMQEISDAEDA